MITNRLVTTRQKKFLDKVFKALDINIEDLIEINNLRVLKEKIKALEARVDEQDKTIKLQSENILSLSNLYEELRRNNERNVYAQILGLEVDDENEENTKAY